MPWFLSILRAWNDCAHRLTVCWTCSPTDNLLLIVTPRIFRLATCSIHGMFGGGEFKDLFLQPAIIMMSFVFVQFNFKLLVNAQCSTFCNSAALVWILLVGIIRYVSSAYLRTELPRKVLCRSAAFTTYVAGPMADPWIILAFIDCMLVLLPPNVVQCSWPWK